MSRAILPNTFIVGIQKAGTTTLDDWLAQHPQIYCYESLKDVMLFFRFKSVEEILQRMEKEPAPYKDQAVVLQSAVNYIFYPQYLEQLSKMSPGAKLILILRNPVDRAVSSYAYFTKMLREKRPMQEALLYEPKEVTVFSKDNSDFTYIEHGFYAKQIKDCFNYFSKAQLLVLDYDDLARNPQKLLQQTFSFLGIDETFQPDLTPKNITGSVKNQLLQDGLINRGKFRKWVVDKIIDPVFPVGKRKMLKRKLFELNTGKKKASEAPAAADKETIAAVKKELQPYFLSDTKELDALLGTDFYTKWFDKKPINETSG
jgi:Sulfotransferase domain